MWSSGYPGMGLKILLSQIYHAKDQWQEFIFVLYSLFPALKVQIAQAGKSVPPMPFMVLGEPEAHEWLVPKLSRFSRSQAPAWERKFPAICFATLSPLHPVTESRFR
jgi:hypothetical protein